MRCAVVLLPLMMLALPARAQLINVRTVPISQGDQFDIFPSSNLGMGGLSFAVADSLLDPFRNPATAARVSSHFFGSPGVYSVSENAGQGRTLPLGAYLRTRRWFGVFALAVQQVDASQQDTFAFPVLDRGFAPPGLGDVRSGPPSHANLFAVAGFGRELPGRVAIAGSISWAGLKAVDGVDLMYAGSQRVDQSGHSFDVRLGLLKSWAGGRSLQAVAVHNRYAMTHDVTYLDAFWDPATQQTHLRERQELNPDQTNTWGLHLQYTHPIAEGWSLGAVATANRMSHPKIPNFAIMNIPRDPGYSDAFNLGVGVGQRDGPSTFGIELLAEPIWSHTWAEATAPVVVDPAGPPIPVGGRTIENRFRFSNAVVRIGAGREFSLGGHDKKGSVQIGLVVRTIRYRMTQDNYADGTVRHLDQSWTEWTPTWGLGFRFPEFELRYRGSVTNGGGRPGLFTGGCPQCAQPLLPGTGTIVAPSGPMQFSPVKIVSHQVSFLVPLRSARSRRSEP